MFVHRRNLEFAIEEKALTLFKIFYTFMFESHRPRQVPDLGTNKTKSSFRLLNFASPPLFTKRMINSIIIMSEFCD